MPRTRRKFTAWGQQPSAVRRSKAPLKPKPLSYLSSFWLRPFAVQSQKLMEIKRTISRVIYCIEPKPEGGFIARCDDPTVPPLEAASRFELEQQIRDKVTSE